MSGAPNCFGVPASAATFLGRQQASPPRSTGVPLHKEASWSSLLAALDRGNRLTSLLSRDPFEGGVDEKSFVLMLRPDLSMGKAMKNIREFAGFAASAVLGTGGGTNRAITHARSIAATRTYDKARVMKKSLSLVGYLLLAACSTEIQTHQEIPTAIRQGMAVKEATAEVAKDVLAPPDTGPKLAAAVLKAASARANGSTPIKLKMTVVRYEMVNGGMRFFTGMFAGSNKLYVTVDVLDGETGAVIGHYEVLREANPGGYGAFYNQVEATIDAAADGVVDGLYGTSTTSSATAPQQP